MVISRFIEVAFFIVIALIAAPLTNVDLCHQAAEVLGVVRQMVELRGVKIENAA
jgi:hypothetical protein